MAVAKLKIIHKTMEGKANTEIFSTSLSVSMDSDTAVAVTDWARQYCSLSQDNYASCELTESVTVDELIEA